MNKKIHIGIYALYPFLLAVTMIAIDILYAYLTFDNRFLDIVLIIYYITPLCGFFYFIKKRPFNQWLLPLGFIPMPIPIFIYEYIYFQRTSAFRVVIAEYVVPFIIISLIIALILSIKDNYKMGRVEANKKLHIGIYAAYPSLLGVLFTLSMPLLRDWTGWAFIIFAVLYYIIPLFGFYYFIKKRPFNQWLLFMGFVPVPLWAYIYEYNFGIGLFQFFYTPLLIIFYTIPFTAISLIIAAILSVKDRRRKRRAEGDIR